MVNAPANIQTILQGGKPAFVVIPYDEYVKFFPEGKTPFIPDGDSLPHEVVKMIHLNEMSPARAWREYLGLTQEEVAGRMGVTQPALAQMETSKRPRRATLEMIATALGLNVIKLI